MRLFKKAFTLIELTVSVLISAIILIFLMIFLADTFNEIAYSNKKTKLLIEFYELENQLKNIKEQYLSGVILKDNIKWEWSDVILLKTSPLEPIQWGYIFAQVNKTSFKIDTDKNVDTVWEKVLGYKKISSIQLTELLLDANKVYNYEFNLDEIFPNILLKDFQAKLYNSWKIFDIFLEVNLNYKKQLNWSKYSEIWNESIEKIIFNF